MAAGLGGGGHREGVFTDPGWDLVAAEIDLGDQGNWEQETLPPPAPCGQRLFLQEAPTSWDIRGSGKDQGLRPWPPGE